jgi:hypothetical protein
MRNCQANSYDMAKNKCLDAKCILILGGDNEIVKAVATLLALNGAIVFLASKDESALNVKLQHIRKQVPGCNITGTTVDITNVNDISRFFLKAAIALPINQILIYFFENRLDNQDFLTASDRLFNSMINHQGGKIVVIGDNAMEKNVTAKLNELVETIHERFNKFAINTTQLYLHSESNITVATPEIFAKSVAHSLAEYFFFTK